MSNVDEKVVSIDNKQVKDTLGVGVYTIYDCVSKQYDLPMCIPVNKIDDYFTIIVNDVNCKYYLHEQDYIINKIGDFNTDTGEIVLHFIERVAQLDKYVNNQKRRLQTIIQTLNYLPQGYFKMPEEMKKSVQENIDLAINNYVENYVIPDFDVNNLKVQKLEEKIQDYEQRLKIVDSDR